MANVTIHTTTTPTPTDLDAFLTLLSTSYLSHPLTTAFITEADSTPPPYPSPTALNPSRIRSHFSRGIDAISHSDILLSFASLTTTSTPQIQSPLLSAAPPTATGPLAIALFEPPSFTSSSTPLLTQTTPHPILDAYRSLSTHLRATHLQIPSTGPDSFTTPAAPSQSAPAPTADPYPADFQPKPEETRPFYHLAFIATKTTTAHGGEEREVDVHDAVAALVAEYQGRAGAEDVPIWVTVASERERDLLTSCGFEVVDQAVVGDGLVDSQGWPAEGARAEGVTVWALKWQP